MHTSVEQQYRISVVIPTYRRRARLAFALEALAEQTLPKEHFETIVVVAPGEDVPDWSDINGLNLRIVEAPAKGPAAQRNHGWRNASAPVVAFTDDDCRPEPGWLEAVLAASGSEATIVQGQTRPDPDELHLLHGRARSMDVQELSPWFPTCNIAYPRALLEHVGGFDESFPQAFGEDTDLGLRAVESGAELRYAEAARVWHAVHARTIAGALREAKRQDAIPLVVAKHPKQQSVLYRGFFVRQSHPNFLLAVFGVLCARRTRLVSLAATYPYLCQNVALHKRRIRAVPRLSLRIAFHLPGRVIVDAVEILVTVRASLRHRVPVL